MRSIALATACCLAAAVSVTAHAASTGGGPPCSPTMSKINGKPVVYWCGPATGTLTTSGKTYTFTKGFCSQSKTAGQALELSIGILAATTKGNAGKPYISIELSKTSGTVNAYDGGRQIANNLVAVAGSFPGHGTFKAKYSGAGFGAAFGGSWNCRGVVYHAP